MSIDKTSSGFPGMNVHKRTTKVNLAVIVSVVLFLAVGMGVAFWFSAHAPVSEVRPAGATNGK